MVKNRKKKPNILILSSKPFKPEPWIYRPSKTLIDNGYEVKIIGWDREKKYKKRDEVDGIKTERISIPAPYGSFIGLLPLYPIFYLIVLIKCINADLDIIECYNFDTLPLGMLIGKLKRGKIIYHPLDFYFTWFNREDPSKFKTILSYLFRKLEIIFLNKIDHLIVTTPAYYEYYKKYTKAKISILMNVPDKKSFLNAMKKYDKKNTENKFIISYIGEIRYEKPLLNLVEAVKSLKEVKILIVGGGIKAQNIKKKLEKYDFVSIIDEVPYKEILKYYIKSDCIYAVYDSSVENIKYAMPVKVLEAMACGIPVVVNKNVWVSKFVKENKIGLCVDENNIDEIREVILKIKNNESMRRNFSKNGRKLFEEEYNWEKQEENLLKIYETL